MLIETAEYKIVSIESDLIDCEIARRLETRYRNNIEVRPPSYKNNDRWQFISKGYIGLIAIGSGISIRILPKVSINNLFLMFDYVYHFDIDFDDDLIDCGSVEEFYDALAKLLADRTNNIIKKGVYRSYVNEHKRTSYIRGKMNLKSLVKNPWSLNFECQTQQFTSNIEDNRIVAWTLFLIANNKACSRSLLSVNRSLKALEKLVELKPCSSEDCINRNYNKLNEHYKPLHALCRFFLDSSGASLIDGDYSMLSFLINMPNLFENFVSEWLKAHLPTRYRLEKQVRYDFASVKFRIDLVLYDTKIDAVKSVIDTKYKSSVDPKDIQQIHFYAAAQNCKDAFLIYPSTPEKYQEESHAIRDINITILVFSLEGNLDQSGQEIMANLLQDEKLLLPSPSPPQSN